MKKLLLNLPDDLFEMLKNASDDNETSMAEIARRAIVDYLTFAKLPYDDKRHEVSPSSDYIQDLTGLTPRDGGKIAKHGGSRKKVSK